MTWLPHEQKNIIEEPTEHHWIVTYYLRPSIVGAIEYSFLVMCLGLLIFFCFSK